MYTYGIDRKEDALQHVLDSSNTVKVGNSILMWDDIYGAVMERLNGELVARHYPKLDYKVSATGNWKWQALSWSTQTY